VSILNKVKSNNIFFQIKKKAYMISIENGRYKRELDQEDSDEDDENMNETQATTSRKSAGKRSKKSEYVLTKPIIEKYIFNSIF
jgi:hypothetical protein